MDLEIENSTGDNDVVCSATLPIVNDVKIYSNGSSDNNDNGRDLNCYANGQPLRSLDPVKTNEDAPKLNSHKIGAVKLLSEFGEHVDSYTVINSEGNGAESGQSVDKSPNFSSGNPATSPVVSGTKGRGLKKWRRIRREVTKDNSPSLDVSKILKRPPQNLLHPLDVAAELKLKSEGSVSSTNALNDNTIGADVFSIDGSSSNNAIDGGPTFSVGADSENSRDTSSKFSTAASVPRHRHDVSRASSHSREKQKVKHMGGKQLGNASQRLQQGEFQAVKMDKENSVSSLESDSRSYSTVFMQGSSSVISNGHSSRMMHGFDGMPTDSIRSAGDNEEFSQGDADLSSQMKERSENHQLSGDMDPFVDCVRMLLSTQEVLEQEIQKFEELGKDLRPVSPEVCRASLASEGTAQNDPVAMEAKTINQSQNIHVLEKQLEEAFTILKKKESKISDLEATLNEMKQSKADLESSVEIQQKKYRELETEIEGLLNQKVEAEFKYLAAEDERTTAEKELQTLLKADNSESKGAVSKGKPKEKLSTQTDIRKIQKKAAKFLFSFLIQLILLALVLQFFASQFLPNSEMVMPT